MCGVTAIITLDKSSQDPKPSRQELLRATQESLGKIQHRGPDCKGHWISEDCSIGRALGHTRLSIQDTTVAATQPLCNRDGDIQVIVNGEFYRYGSLREELVGQQFDFRTSSDSELLIALYERDGINCLSHLDGEFAFVLYDAKRQLVFAARDRYGVKPLFWTIAGDRLLIASEAKAFLPLGWQPEWDVRSLVEDGWLHDERTLFRDVRKVLPGHYMTCRSFDYVREQAYWEADFPTKTVKDTRSEREMVLNLRRLLYQSVELRTQGDAPIGVYLSGGLDSAIIAGILADIVKSGKTENTKLNNTEAPLTCFGVGFQEDTEYDEMPIAQRTADHLGVRFIGQRLDEAALADNFEATTMMCEHHNPDLNSVGKFILSKLAADHGVKVVLSGEGADEHFGGYSQFKADSVREPDLSWGQNAMNEHQRETLLRKFTANTTPGYKGVLQVSATSTSGLARRMLNNSNISACLWAVTVAPFAAWTKSYGQLSVQETRASSTGGRALNLINTRWHPLHTAQYIWTRSILPNLILTSMGDRMEMAHSIEGRTPFLDYDLTQYANHLPPSTKVKVDVENGDVTEKWILREAGKPYISQELYERRKHPFTAPHVYNTGGPLHKLLLRLLTPENVERLGFVDTQEAATLVERAFDSHDQNAMRMAFNVAQWIVLSKQFGVPTAGSQNQATVQLSRSMKAVEKTLAGYLVHWVSRKAGPVYRFFMQMQVIFGA